MSTSATQSGTTTGAGRSGKGVGFAAAALAIVIAAGFVFALNQGNDATVSNASTRAAQIAAERYEEKVQQLEAAYQASTRPDGAAELERLNDLALQVRGQGTASAELNRLNDLALQVKAQSHPAFNIERTRMEMAGTLAVAQVVPDADILEYKRLRAEQLQAARVIEHPGVSPEKTRIEMLTQKLGEASYVPSLVKPVPTESWSEGNLDLIRAQAQSRQPSELDQPEWDNRMP